MNLTVKNGRFSYSSEPPYLFDGLSMEAEGGDVVAILGPNGSGKTTLLRCVMGFLKWEGSACLDGEDISHIPDRRLWQHIAYVPQARNAVSAYTVFETVLLGRTGRMGVFSAPKEIDAEAAGAALRRLNIEKLSDKSCGALSGGELQMVLIARALACDPSVLILDEPESNLDFRNQLLVLDAMSDLAAHGIACIFNTHYPAHALSRANKALLLDGRGGSLFGGSAQVVTEANIERAFGVRAVIGEIETPGKTVSQVVPLSLSAKDLGRLSGAGDGERCIAVVSLICPEAAPHARINAVLHEYSRLIIGRMGLPCPDAGVNVINVTLDAPRALVAAMTSRLSLIQGVDVKTTYSSAAFIKE